MLGLEEKSWGIGKLNSNKWRNQEWGVKDRKEILESKKHAGGEITTLRNRLQKSIHSEFIIDVAQPPGEVELRKNRFASQFPEIGGSGIGTNPENEATREDQIIET